MIYNEELLHWLALNKPASPVIFTSALHKEIIHLYKKLALDIKFHSFLKTPLAYFDLVISDTFITSIGFISILWSGHLVDWAIPIARLYQQLGFVFGFAFRH